METNDTGGDSPEFVFSSDDEPASCQSTDSIVQTQNPETMDTEVNGKATSSLVSQAASAHPGNIPMVTLVNETRPIEQNLLNSLPSHLNQSPVYPSTSDSSSNPANPRPKVYPPGSKGPFLVFFRPKPNGKKLNKLQIAKDLEKSFRGILEVDSPSRDKLRVTVSDRDQANRIANYELFSREYRTYLPSLEIECHGVVTEDSLTRASILAGAGGFKNRAVPLVPVLDAVQMNKAQPDGSKKPSQSFRVTFSGSALPSVLVVGLLRLPVRLYEPKVMHCEKCRQLGHTALYCSNKPRCGLCGEQHAEGPCNMGPKCATCGQTPPHDISACPKYVEREKRSINSLKQRSRRSYAEMLKNITSAAVPPTQPPTNNNIFASLPDDDQGSDSEGGGEYTIIETGTKRKRAVAKRHMQQRASQNVPVAQPTLQTPLVKSRSGGNTKKVTPPGFKFSAGDFPSLPGASKTPVAPVFRPESQQTSHQERRPNPVDLSGKLTLSGIVDIIFETLNVSPTIRSLINMALPFVKTLLKHLASRWPILESFISFDG
ncbi:uncharacterized protein LOC134289821 [Aedes albopictus]|uniref:Nucleic-acid-binding protein from transposon X-element n=1 Tax=Aedes albopictus TaxID=7160 RepID=A0ABM1XS37_AEDAL